MNSHVGDEMITVDRLNKIFFQSFSPFIELKRQLQMSSHTFPLNNAVFYYLPFEASFTSCFRAVESKVTVA